jgi:leucyl-tRNA synthetase
MKMSKSRGNVVNPDTYVSTMGADTVRAYLMFIAPWEKGGDWNDSGISGVYRWLNRVWNLVLEEYREDPSANPADRQKAEQDLVRMSHQTIGVVTEDLEKLRFNTMIASLMELTNYLTDIQEKKQVGQSVWKDSIDALILMLAPSTPHLAEELWTKTGHGYSIHNQKWPAWSEKLAEKEEITLVIQVNGKLRDRITVPKSIAEEDAKKLALDSQKVKAFIEGKTIANIFFVRGKLINLVVR